MKKLLIVMYVFVFIPFGSFAKDTKNLYSKVSTTFTVSKSINCDEAVAKFVVYAEGDNYSLALERLSKINNAFILFLEKEFSKQEVKTTNSYNYSKTAKMYIEIRTKKIKKISDVLDYIAKKQFLYKAGIKPVYVNFDLSEKLKNRIKQNLFRAALIEAKKRLSIVNKTLSEGYKISKISSYSQYQNIYAQNREMAFSLTKSKSLQSIRITPGNIIVKSNVSVEFIKILK